MRDMTRVGLDKALDSMPHLPDGLTGTGWGAGNWHAAAYLPWLSSPYACHAAAASLTAQE